MNTTFKKIIRFLIVGLSVVVFNLVLLHVFTEVFDIWYLFSSICAYILSVILNFFLQKVWVFEHTNSTNMHRQFMSYAIVSLGYLGLNTLGMYLLVGNLHVPYLTAQAGITLVLAVINFYINQTYIFKHA